ncbi:MAG TPA: hypothetical protein PKD83_14000 [Ignavibacteria bacterium]|nr:hypothetical protein [Ignavibacteria bacterium]
MKSKISVAVILVSLFFLNVISYADSDFDKAMLKAKKSLKEAMDKGDEAKIIKARGQFERILQLKKDVWLVNYYMALSDYGLATTGMGSNDTERIKKYTQSGIDVLNKSIDENPEFADSYILLETLNFNRWQYEQDKMQEIISATQSADAEAKKLEPNNPRLSLINGIASFYTPEAFGGGVAIAIPLLEKSLQEFKTRKEKKDIYPDWGQDLAIGYLSMSLIKRNDDGDISKAKEYIDTGLKNNPDSGFLSGYVMKEYKENIK